LGVYFFDGGGKADQAVYRNGIWWIRQSLNGQIIGRELSGLPQGALLN
jgi:hypothetical protein